MPKQITGLDKKEQQGHAHRAKQQKNPQISGSSKEQFTMQVSTVDALSTVIRHELPEQMENMRRDVERARMEKEDMRCKMVELSTRIQMDHEKIIEMPEWMYWSWRGYSHGMTRWLDYVLNGRYDPMFR